MYIMLVEDDSRQRLALERILRDHGHRICWSATAIGAIDLLRTEEVDLILLDFELDGTLDGRFVAKHVARKVPVFMISGYDVDHMKATVSNTLDGVTLFFSKPLDVDDLLVAIERVDRTRHDP